MNFDKMENVGNFNILQFPRAEFYKTNIKLRVAAGPVRIQGFHPRRCAAYSLPAAFSSCRGDGGFKRLIFVVFILQIFLTI